MTKKDADASLTMFFVRSFHVVKEVHAHVVCCWLVRRRDQPRHVTGLLRS